MVADPTFASRRGQGRSAEILDRMHRDVDRRAANVTRDGLAAGIDSMIAEGR